MAAVQAPMVENHCIVGVDIAPILTPDIGNPISTCHPTVWFSLVECPMAPVYMAFG